MSMPITITITINIAIAMSVHACNVSSSSPYLVLGPPPSNKVGVRELFVGFESLGVVGVFLQTNDIRELQNGQLV